MCGGGGGTYLPLCETGRVQLHGSRPHAGRSAEPSGAARPRVLDTALDTKRGTLSARQNGLERGALVASTGQPGATGPFSRTAGNTFICIEQTGFN